MKVELEEEINGDKYTIEVGSLSNCNEKEIGIIGKNVCIVFELNKFKEIISNLEIMHDAKIFLEQMRKVNNGG